MATVKLTLDTRRAKEDGTFPIKLLISHLHKSAKISTGISVVREQFNGKEISKKAPNCSIQNMKLRTMISTAEATLLDLIQKGNINHISALKIKEVIEERMKGKPLKSEKYFIDYLNDFASLKSNPGTRGVYEQTRVKIEAYDPKSTFETIDITWLKKFEAWMMESGVRTNARGIHLRNIRAIFNYAIDEEKITLYPFRKFRIRKEETPKRALSVKDLITLRDYSCEDHQIKYRDMFMLMFYLIGINPVDLFQLKEIRNNRIEYHRAKTGKLYSIEILPEARQIINKYQGEGYLLNILDTWNNYKDFAHRMNINLKQIGEVERVGLGGKKIRTALFPDITIYHARHTWASIAASLDIPKETISAALGHEIGSKVTSIYIDFDRKKVDEANKRVIECLNTI
ncbi:site-specific integrase [uncultured Bacteroides sp.]|uniref:site-specific integrase n=1 Tax=uncultured Bacteroides sp. TaxID=162156 RepID=UPI002AA84788|nr:site-specific integrase [uncultured Bacteroides sp.]